MVLGLLPGLLQEPCLGCRTAMAFVLWVLESGKQKVRQSSARVCRLEWLTAPLSLVRRVASQWPLDQQSTAIVPALLLASVPALRPPLRTESCCRNRTTMLLPLLWRMVRARKRKMHLWTRHSRHPGTGIQRTAMHRW